MVDTAYLMRRRGKGRSGYRLHGCVAVPADLQPLFRKRAIERALACRSVPWWTVTAEVR